MTTGPTDESARVRTEATGYVNQRHPQWHDNGVGITQGSHYRTGFIDGAVWQAERAGRESVAAEPATGFWECGRCGGSSGQHALSGSTCVWEPVWHSTVAPRITREELAKLLVDEGLAEAERGYGHATGEQVAAFVLSALGMTEEGQ